MGEITSLAKLQKAKLGKLQDKVMVLVTGVFDILHYEHFKFLQKAKQQGDVLVVAIESDTRVRQLKGQGRPVNSQTVRLQNLAALKMVDFVFILPQNLSCRKGREQFIQKLKPDIYAVSSSTPFIKEKRRIMRKFKGRLKVVHPYNPQISTTKIIHDLKNHYQSQSDHGKSAKMQKFQKQGKIIIVRRNKVNQDNY